MKKKRSMYQIYKTQPVLISKEIHRKLLEEKSIRGMSVNAMASRLIEKGLTLNVLDMK